MPGAWEIGNPEVLVCILTRETVPFRWAEGYANFVKQLPPSAQRIPKSGGTFDHMRNMGCVDALKHGFEWLFFLDDDVIPPADTFRRLANHKKDIVSGLYYRRQEPIHPVAMRFVEVNKQIGVKWVTHGELTPGLMEVDLVGGGCLLIHRRVLERMKPPWFDWEIGKEITDDPTKAQPFNRMSEDFSFCRRAKHEYGFRVFLDTSVQCEHMGLGKSVVGGNFIPGSS